jgi:hypothetical protein
MARKKSSALKAWSVNTSQFRNPINEAKERLNIHKRTFKNLSTQNIYANVKNPYADIQTDFENVYEDMIGVDTTGTDKSTQEFQQNLANTLDLMQKMGTVNAQDLANATLKQSQDTRAALGGQIRESQMLRASGAEKVQTAETKADLKVKEGAHMAEMTRLEGAKDARNLEYQKTQGLMALEAAELESARANRQASRNWFNRTFA